MPLWIRILLRTLLTAALVAACLDNVMAAVPERMRWQLRLLIIVAAVAGLGGTVRRRIRLIVRRPPREPDGSGGCGPSRRDIYHSANLVLDRYESPDRPDEDPSAVFLFTRLLVEETHLARVAEDVRLSGDMMAIDVTMEVSLDALRHEPDEPSLRLPRDGRIVVPILRRKDLVLESFEARDSADNKLTHLPQRLTDGLLAWTVKSLYELTYAPGSTDLSGRPPPQDLPADGAVLPDRHRRPGHVRPRLRRDRRPGR